MSTPNTSTPIWSTGQNIFYGLVYSSSSDKCIITGYIYCCLMEFSLIKLKILQSGGKIWMTDLHFIVLTIYNYIIYWHNINISS